MADSRTGRDGPFARLAEQLQLALAGLSGPSDAHRGNRVPVAVREALRGLSPGELETFFDRLVHELPGWDAAPPGGPVPGEGPVAGESGRDRAAPPAADGWMPLVFQLCEASPALADEQKQAAIDALADAGFPVEASAPAFPEDAVRDACKLLPGLSAADLDTVRLLEAVASLGAFASGLQAIVRLTWKELAPEGERHRGMGHLEQMIVRHLAGDPAVPPAALAREIRSLRASAASLIAALGSGVSAFAESWFARLSPDAIQQSVCDEAGGKVPAAMPARCWAKYQRLAEEITPVSIQNDLRAALARDADDRLRGLDDRI